MKTGIREEVRFKIKCAGKLSVSIPTVEFLGIVMLLVENKLQIEFHSIKLPWNPRTEFIYLELCFLESLSTCLEKLSHDLKSGVGEIYFYHLPIAILFHLSFLHSKQAILIKIKIKINPNIQHPYIITAALFWLWSSVAFKCVFCRYDIPSAH